MPSVWVRFDVCALTAVGGRRLFHCGDVVAEKTGPSDTMFMAGAIGPAIAAAVVAAPGPLPGAGL